MRISDWSSDVCSSDLLRRRRHRNGDRRVLQRLRPLAGGDDDVVAIIAVVDRRAGVGRCGGILSKGICGGGGGAQHGGAQQYVAQSHDDVSLSKTTEAQPKACREMPGSEIGRHPSELQSLMRTSYAV